MNRRGGAWIAIICILVIGVSVTKMTKNFVSSEKTETAALSSVMEAGAADSLGIGRSAMPGSLAGYAAGTDTSPASVDKAMAKAVAETPGAQADTGASGALAAGAQEGTGEQAGEGTQTDIGVQSAAGDQTVIGAQTDADDPAAFYAQSAAGGGQTESPAGQNGMSPAEAQENVAETDTAKQGMGDALSGSQTSDMISRGAPEPSAVSGEAGSQMTVIGESVAAETFAASEEAAAEAADMEAEVVKEVLIENVKSPLDPAVETESADVRVSVISNKTYTYEELLARLETAESQAEIYKEAQNDTNPGSVYIATEQEWNLWDKELNLIYSTIRSKMSPEEAELLKHEEVEWIKERDLEADKAMYKSKNQLTQNTDYIRTSTDKTRERCYELISDYEDILKREDKQETRGIPN